MANIVVGIHEVARIASSEPTGYKLAIILFSMDQKTCAGRVCAE